MSPFLFKDLKEPKSEHVTQVNIYLYLSGLKTGKLLYEDKGLQSTKEFLVKRDDELIRVKKEEALNLKFQITNRNKQGKRVLPPRAHGSKGDEQCLGCKYRGGCWK